MSENNSRPTIKIKNLSVTYFLGRANEFRALKDINLEIYPGEFVIFFGPSGCGKSTLLYSISGLETNIVGDIFVEDKNISAMTEKEKEILHQKKIGMIFQAYYLISSLSVLQNVLLPQIAIGISKNEREKKALELLSHFGVEKQANKLPNELSGGQQQRVAICRALVNEPNIIFADEPVGNLDSQSAEDVMVLLRALNREHKKTVVLVTHNPIYLPVAHRVFYMKDGAIIKIKTNNDVYKEVSVKKVEAEEMTVSKDLEYLAKSFSGLKDSAGNLLIPFKAKEIVMEILTGMTDKEIHALELKVRNLLINSLADDEKFIKFLDDEIEKGGLGLDKRSANNLGRKIIDYVGEIKLMQAEESKARTVRDYGVDKEVVSVRHYLLESFDLSLKTDDQVQRMNKAIFERLNNKIDKKNFYLILDKPLKEGGVGLDRRSARKISERLELLILGKFK